MNEEWNVGSGRCAGFLAGIRYSPWRASTGTDGDWVRCDLRWRQTLDGKQTEISASYLFDERGIEVRLQNPIGEMESLRAEPDVVFFPLMRIYSGEVVHRLRRRGAGRVLVPWIGDGGQARRLFRPDYSERRVEAVGEDRICIDGAARNCVEYDYSGGPYPPGTRFWIDENGMLLRYRWQQTMASAGKSGCAIGEPPWRLDPGGSTTSAHIAPRAAMIAEGAASAVCDRDRA